MDAIASGLPADGFERGSVGDQPILQVAPQRNRQAPGERHDADASQALASTGKANRRDFPYSKRLNRTASKCQD